MSNSYTNHLKRVFDFFLSVLLLLVLLLPMIFISFMITALSPGKALYWSQRAGRNDSFFWMPKFRTMHIDTPVVATHLLSDIDENLTKIGRFLRKTSLDELPQLYSILKGDMSFVGPRPALFNQDDLISLRKDCGVNKLLPGLTGWAQVNGRDNISIKRKVDFDAEYLHRKSFTFDIKIILITLLNSFKGKDISH